jgi:hypothetical protein
MCQGGKLSEEHKGYYRVKSGAGALANTVTSDDVTKCDVL